MDLLDGKKTYIAAIVMAVAAAAHAMGWITTEQWENLTALAGAGGIAALRAGVQTAVKQITEQPQGNGQAGRATTLRPS